MMLGRSDPHYLLILRRFVADFAPDGAAPRHLAPVAYWFPPNIFWTKDNWIKTRGGETAAAVVPLVSRRD